MTEFTALGDRLSSEDFIFISILVNWQPLQQLAGDDLINLYVFSIFIF